MSSLTSIRMFTLALGGILIFLVACGEDLDDAAQTEAEMAQEGDEADEAEEAEPDADEADDADAAGDQEEAGDDRADWPETIAYGLLPSGDVTEELQNHDPFEQYMADCFDHPFELYTATDYVAMIEAMRNDHVQFAKFGPFAYILAHERAGAEAFVSGAEEEDSAVYRAIFVTLEQHGFDEVTDLAGETFGFVDPGSASGHVFPRAYMVDQFGVSNEELESELGDIVFTGGHEQSMIAVLNEEVSAAAISENAWVNHIDNDDTFEDHQNFEGFYVLDETEDIPRALEAYQSDIPESLQETAQGCFENAIDEPGMDEFWTSYNYPAGFIPVEDGTFDVVRDAAEAMDMSPEDLLEG